MDKTKRLAKECIILAMEEVKGKIECIPDTATYADQVNTYCEALKKLSEAYKNIAK